MALGKKTGGREKGTPNRITSEIREEFKIFLHYASPKIQELWERLIEDNPKEALNVIKDYAEFVLPKLAREEVTQETVNFDGHKLHIEDKELLEKLGYNTDE